jgi:hypothetical protein
MSSSNTKVLRIDLAAIAASQQLPQFLLDPCSPCDDEPTVVTQPTSIRNQHKQAKKRFPPSSSAPSSTTRCLIFESNITTLDSNGDWYNIETEHILPIEVQLYLDECSAAHRRLVRYTGSAEVPDVAILGTYITMLGGDFMYTATKAITLLIEKVTSPVLL